MWKQLILIGLNEENPLLSSPNMIALWMLAKINSTEINGIIEWHYSQRYHIPNVAREGRCLVVGSTSSCEPFSS